MNFFIFPLTVNNLLLINLLLVDFTRCYCRSSETRLLLFALITVKNPVIVGN